MSLCLLYCVLSAALQQALRASDPFHEVVVRDLFEPETAQPNLVDSWSAASALGYRFDSLSGTYQFEHFMLSGSSARASRRFFAEPWRRVMPRAHKFLASVAVVGAPPGWRLASLTPLPNQGVGIWDAATLGFIGYVQFPPSPIPGLDPIEFYYGIWSAGDTDSDGFDDLFFTTEQNQGYAVTGLIDGRSLAVRWIHYESPLLEDYYPILDSSVSALTDLDGDAIADLVTGFGHYPPASPSVSVVARSGVDGRLLWTKQLSGWYGYSAGACGLDLNADDASEVFMASSGSSANPGQFSMQDGRNGSTLWSGSSRILDGLLPANVDQYHFPGPVWMETVQRQYRSTNELCLFTPYFTYWPIRTHAYVTYLDANTGETLAYLPFPRTLSPWSTQSTALLQSCFLLGDVDRDGYSEYGVPVHLPPTLLSGMAMFGRRTLVLPENIDAGEFVTLSLSIPSAPGQEFFLLFADEFALRGGERVDGWRTNFKATPLFNYSHRTRPGAGLLDGNGHATVSVIVPALPVPSGTKLYARAVILEPGTQEEVWTLSSVETLRYE
jgi:hypothetical protein